MHLYDELIARGLIADATDADELRRALSEERLTFYAGYDPTATSLHAGNLVPLSLMTRLARAGHKMIAVIGGATGVVGDPSGRSAERKLLSREDLARNLAGIGGQIRRFVGDETPVLDNAEWIGALSFLEFLRDVGKLITVNYMLAKESVRARLEDREQGISYTEFSYMLLQAYDFAHLAKTRGCRLQVGGSDQWGNITCGIELARKSGVEARLFGIVTPLLLTASGKKFGKSEEGAVWIDPGLTSPYRFYQYWINTEDADAPRYLKMFTFLSLDAIDELVRQHQADPGKRAAQRQLAREVTTWVHGAETTRRVEAASGVMFGGSLAELRDADLAPLLADLPSTEIPRTELDRGIPLLDLLVRVKLVESRGAGKRLLDQRGVYVNNVQVGAEPRSIGLPDLATETMIVLRAGKKSYHVIRVV